MRLKVLAVRFGCSTHEYDSNRFLAFEINEEGIQPPVISDVPSAIGTYLKNRPIVGTMKFSSDYSKVAIFGGNSNIIELAFDFDNTTGKVSNALKLREGTYKGSGLVRLFFP